MADPAALPPAKPKPNALEDWAGVIKSFISESSEITQDFGLPARNSIKF